jgi:hypothetical protein
MASIRPFCHPKLMRKFWMVKMLDGRWGGGREWNYINWPFGIGEMFVGEGGAQFMAELRWTNGGRGHSQSQWVGGLNLKQQSTIMTQNGRSPFSVGFI